MNRLHSTASDPRAWYSFYADASTHTQLQARTFWFLLLIWTFSLAISGFHRYTIPSTGRYAPDREKPNRALRYWAGSNTCVFLRNGRTGPSPLRLSFWFSSRRKRSPFPYVCRYKRFLKLLFPKVIPLKSPKLMFKRFIEQFLWVSVE